MFKGWKTLTFNLVATLPMVFELVSTHEVRALIPAEYLPIYAVGIAVGNLILRVVTTTAVGRSQ